MLKTPIARVHHLCPSFLAATRQRFQSPLASMITIWFIYLLATFRTPHGELIIMVSLLLHFFPCPKVSASILWSWSVCSWIISNTRRIKDCPLSKIPPAAVPCIFVLHSSSPQTLHDNVGSHSFWRPVLSISSVWVGTIHRWLWRTSAVDMHCLELVCKVSHSLEVQLEAHLITSSGALHFDGTLMRRCCFKPVNIQTCWSMNLTSCNYGMNLVLLVISSIPLMHANEWTLTTTLQPFTNDFPQADICCLLSPKILHQLIKGTFKDHLVDWVKKFLVKMHDQTQADIILNDIDWQWVLVQHWCGTTGLLL